jgi:hypothetical protein
VILSTAVVVDLPCNFAGCTNAARYITATNYLACGTCAVKHKVDAIKIASVPELLSLVRNYLSIEDSGERIAESGIPSPQFRPEMWSKQFRKIVGKDASTG